MEKKMYNQPLTITTEVETMSVIMGATASLGGKENELTGSSEEGAPPRYPQY